MLINKLDDKRLANGRRYFEYHCYEGEDSADAELWHHTHQTVTIVRRITHPEIDEEVSPMYQVRFADGFEWEIFNDELVESPDDYYRPDYKE